MTDYLVMVPKGSKVKYAESEYIDTPIIVDLSQMRRHLDALDVLPFVVEPWGMHPSLHGISVFDAEREDLHGSSLD